MSIVNIYKSINNGDGGEIDTTTSSSIFTLDSTTKYCCIYVKNESLVSKYLQNIYVSSLDNILIGIVKENNNIVFNQISEKGVYPSLDYVSSINLKNTKLESTSFITLWLKLETTSEYKSKRNVNISLEYIDEY